MAGSRKPRRATPTNSRLVGADDRCQHRRVHAFKFLVIDDQSPEFPVALLYAGLRARATRASVVILSVVERAGLVHWMSISEDMRAAALSQARAAAEQHTALLAAQEVASELVFAETELKPAIRALLDRDPAIRAIVLATATGRSGPGPLVASLAKGLGFGARPVAVVVLPGDLTREAVEELAGQTAT